MEPRTPSRNGTARAAARKHTTEKLRRGARPQAARWSGLEHLVSDRDVPAIVRATALDPPARSGPAGGRLGVQARDDPDPLVRSAAASAPAAVAVDQRVLFAAPLCVT